MELAVYNKEGEEVEKVTLDEAKLGESINHDAIKQVVVAYETNQRQGNATTKTRADLTYSTKKMFKQKGTGKARAGRNGAPHWRGGAVAMGPRGRDFSVSIPQKLKKAAMRSVLLSKIQDGQLKVVDAIGFEAPKTKSALKMLSSLSVNSRCLIVTDEHNDATYKCFRNIPNVDVRLASDLNAYDLLNNQVALFTKAGVVGAVERYAK